MACSGAAKAVMRSTQQKYVYRPNTYRHETLFVFVLEITVFCLVECKYMHFKTCSQYVQTRLYSLTCTASNIRLAVAVYAPAPADMFFQASWINMHHVPVEVMPKFNSV